MADEEETADPGPDGLKASKRDRFKDVLARTRTKFSKNKEQNDKQDHILSEDVNDFLTGGHTSISSQPSLSDNILPASARPPTSDSFKSLHSPNLSPANSLSRPQQSPRRIPVPRLDVSNSQRWPNANLINSGDNTAQNALLRPTYHGRSKSAIALASRRTRARGLSVTFLETPPIVIGEGGDEAQTPPVEISKARARAKSLSSSSARTTPDSYTSNSAQTPLQREALPQVATDPYTPPEGLMPQHLQRAPTGSSLAAKAALDREFEMSLQIGPGAKAQGQASTDPGASAPIHAPRPIHPPAAIPHVKEQETGISLRTIQASKDLRMQYEEGNALRRQHHRDLPDASLANEQVPQQTDDLDGSPTSTPNPVGSISAKKEKVHFHERHNLGSEDEPIED